MQQYRVHQVLTLSTRTALDIYKRHGVDAEAPGYNERSLVRGHVVNRFRRVAPGYVMVPAGSNLTPSDVNSANGKPIVFRAIGTLDGASMDRMRATPDDDKVPVRKVVRKGDRVRLTTINMDGTVMRTTGTKAIVKLDGKFLGGAVSVPFDTLHLHPPSS